MMQLNGKNGNSLAKCDWIVFDAVGTLLYPNPTVAEAYQTVASGHGSQLSVGEIGDRFRTAFRQSEMRGFGELASNSSSGLSSQEIEVARWRWIVGQVVPDVRDLEQCFSDLWDHFACPQSWSCFDEVGASLSKLSERGYRLAIASNFDSRLHPVCKGHPDLDPIERCFVSSETGFRKPAAEFYAAMISELKCAPNRILMIGDDPDHDVAGPISVGMNALLLDRRLSTSSSNAIHSLSELIVDGRIRLNEAT